MGSSVSRMAESAVATLEAVLKERGPLTEDDLMVRLVEAGIDLGAEPAEALHDLIDESEAVLPISGDRWALIAALLEGRTFTHRLTDAELEHDLVAIRPDLGPLPILLDDDGSACLSDGSAVEEVFPFDVEHLTERGIPVEAIDDEGSLLLAPGSLRSRNLAAGDLLGVRATAHGLALERIDDDQLCDPAGLSSALLAGLAAHDDEPQFLDLAVSSACAEDPTLFRDPLPPLRDVFASSGLAFDGDLIAAEGFDFERWRVSRRYESIAERHELSDEQALAVLVACRI